MAATAGVKGLLRATVPSTGAVCLGDYTCQWLEDPSYWQKERTQRMAVATFFVMSPVQYGVMLGLERVVPGTTTAAVLKKTALNGVLSIGTVSLNFSVNNYLEGKPASALHSKIEKQLGPTIVNGVCYWPFVHALNFKYVALHNRPLAGSLAGIVWQTYMSSVVNTAPGSPTLSDRVVSGVAETGGELQRRVTVAITSVTQKA